MSEFITPAHSAIYTRLAATVATAGPTTSIYDDVPDLPEGMPSANFPYVVIGDITDGDWDTDDTLGGVVNVSLHVWSRYEGKKQAMAIMGQIYAALHRHHANLAATGYRFVDCLEDFAEVFEDPDGITRHGMCRYKITVQKE